MAVESGDVAEAERGENEDSVAAGHVSAWFGRAGHGSVRQGKGTNGANNQNIFTGAAWSGTVRSGTVSRGLAGCVRVRYGHQRCKSIETHGGTQ